MTSFKSILVHIDGSAGCAQRVRVARQLVDAFDAEAIASYCVMPSLMRNPTAIEGGSEAVSIMEQLDRDRRNKAQTLFEANRGHSAKVRWVEQAGGAPWSFVQQAFYADLLVLGQRDVDKRENGDVPQQFIPSVLIESGKPALLLPYIGATEPIGRTVLVAWKETREAARAVSAALPWLRRATQVHVIAYGEDVAVTLGSVVDYLKCHGVAASTHASGPDSDSAGESLLSRAADLGADLLVMGCYGHSRTREFVMGGMTRSILQSMTLPVLMVH